MDIEGLFGTRKLDATHFTPVAITGSTRAATPNYLGVEVSRTIGNMNIDPQVKQAILDSLRPEGSGYFHESLRSDYVSEKFHFKLFPLLSEPSSPLAQKHPHEVKMYIDEIFSGFKPQDSNLKFTHGKIQHLIELSLSSVHSSKLMEAISTFPCVLTDRTITYHDEPHFIGFCSIQNELKPLLVNVSYYRSQSSQFLLFTRITEDIATT